MSRKHAKSIDQIEQQDDFIFSTRDAKQPLPEAPKQDKRSAPKEFEVVRDTNGLYRIKYTAGGEVPDELKGHFTNIARAQDAITNVLVTRKQKEQQVRVEQ